MTYLNPLIFYHFDGIFTTKIDEPYHKFTEKVVPRVTQEMNEGVLESQTAEEVKKGLCSIGDLKAQDTVMSYIK